MHVIRPQDARSERGPETRFEGEVALARLIEGEDGVTLSVVRFADGARTFWHVHPGEQVLYVLEGECQVGTEDRLEEGLQPGATVHVPPGEKHWHGAAPGTSMTHLSITTHGSATWLGPPPPR